MCVQKGLKTEVVPNCFIVFTPLDAVAMFQFHGLVILTCSHTLCQPKAWKRDHQEKPPSLSVRWFTLKAEQTRLLQAKELDWWMTLLKRLETTRGLHKWAQTCPLATYKGQFFINAWLLYNKVLAVFEDFLATTVNAHQLQGHS